VQSGVLYLMHVVIRCFLAENRRRTAAAVGESNRWGLGSEESGEGADEGEDAEQTKVQAITAPGPAA
jgi:hypothetical protein